MATDGEITGRERGLGRPRAPFLTPRALSIALRAREVVSDLDFDRFVFGRVRGACRDSTPLAVALRAAELLTEGKAVRVLDVRAGVGKFSIIGALTTPALFTGIERQLPLVRTARGMALRLGAARTTFVHGSVEDLDLGAFDALYLFDPPFGQADGSSRLVDGNGMSLPDSSASCTASTWRKLREARRGIRIVTYLGESPPGFRVLAKEPAGVDHLVLSIKE